MNRAPEQVHGLGLARLLAVTWHGGGQRVCQARVPVGSTRGWKQSKCRTFHREHVMVKSSRARVGLDRFLQSSQSSSQVGCVTSGFITSLNTCISAVPFSAVWVGGTVILALYMLLKMALSNLTLFSHTLHTDLGYTIFFFKFFCSAKHNFKIRNCFSADACGSAFHFISR